MTTDREYLARRVQEERRLAEQAADPSAYRAHIELARGYERQLVARDGHAQIAPPQERTKTTA